MPPTDAEIRDLYQRYAPVLHRRSISILGNEEDARDCVQETFARVILHWETFRHEASPLTWMYRISTNWCLNRMRDRAGRARKRVQHREAIVGDGFTEPGGEAWEVEETVRRLLGEIPDEETRAIVVHLFYDDMTREEAARMVGMSVPTLRKRLNGFLDRARRSLEPRRSAGLAGACLGLLAIACCFATLDWMRP